MKTSSPSVIVGADTGTIAEKENVTISLHKKVVQHLAQKLMLGSQWKIALTFHKVLPKQYQTLRLSTPMDTENNMNQLFLVL